MARAWELLAFAAGQGLEIFQLLGGEGLLLAGAGGFGGAVLAAGEFGVEGELVGLGLVLGH